MKISAGEKEVGEVTSVATLRSGDAERTIALGYIRREGGVPGRDVTIAAAKVTVIQLPVDNALLSTKSAIKTLAVS